MKKILACCLSAALIVSLAGCSRSGSNESSEGGVEFERYQKDLYNLKNPLDSWFNTEIRFVAYAESREEFDRYCAAIEDELDRLHQLFNIYDEYEGVNNLRTVNLQAGKEPVKVDPDILSLLQLSVDAYGMTESSVNVAMGSVLGLWHRYREEGGDPSTAQLPSMEELQVAAQHMDIAGMVLDLEASTVYLSDPDMSLDVGAIAKGYAAQKAIDRAVEAGLQNGILNAGGNVCVVGAPQDGREHWSIDILDPERSPTGAMRTWDTLLVSGTASVVTSGDYQRYYTVDGAEYHHIIDPATLYPAMHVKAVTIIHPDSAMADLLSTAAFVLPLDDAMELVNEWDAEAVWILQEGGSVHTDGYLALSQGYGA